MVAAMIAELELRKDYLGGQAIATLYFGGGTPSLLPVAELVDLLKATSIFFAISPEAEVTLEANPDDLGPSYLDELKAAGINRLSIGIQSFNDSILKSLNRIHDGKRAIAAYRDARERGFDNISIDLIYGIPGLSTDQWKNDIARAIELAPDHLSAYALTIEPRTVFGNWTSKGKMPMPDDDVAATQLEILASTLEDAGYEHYEVSNFCLPGKESRHNTAYWHQKPYLGIGPGAHSYDLRSRQHNVANNHQYVRSLQRGKVPFEREVLSPENIINEYLLTTMRTKWGSDLNLLREKYGYDILQRHATFIESLIHRKLVIIEHDILRLTRAGRLLADKITSELFLG